MMTHQVHDMIRWHPTKRRIRFFSSTPLLRGPLGIDRNGYAVVRGRTCSKIERSQIQGLAAKRRCRAKKVVEEWSRSRPPSAIGREGKRHGSTLGRDMNTVSISYY